MTMLTRDQWILNRIREVFPDTRKALWADEKNLLKAYACWCIYGGQDWSTFRIYMDSRNRTLIYGGVHPELVR
jgi:hypothetical protein